MTSLTIQPPNTQHRPSIFKSQNQMGNLQVLDDSKSRTQMPMSQATSSVNPNQPLQLNEEDVRESRVSKRLSDLTTKRVIAIVLLLLFIMPLFQANYFFDVPQSIDFATKSLLRLSYLSSVT